MTVATESQGSIISFNLNGNFTFILEEKLLKFFSYLMALFWIRYRFFFFKHRQASEESNIFLFEIALLNSALVGRLIDLGESHLSQNQTESFPNQNQNEKQLSDSVTAGVQHGMERPAAQ